MSNVRIELNRAGVGELLKSSEVRADLARRASAIAAAAAAAGGGTFGHEASVGKSRARAAVWTEDVEAMLAEANHRALTRAIDAGRR